jgi:hypothetical protein
MSKNPPSWLKSFAKKKAKPNENGTSSSTSASRKVVCADVENEGIRGEEEDYMSNSLIPDVPAHRPQPEVEDVIPRSLPNSGFYPQSCPSSDSLRHREPKSLKRSMAEALEGGLSQPLGSENLGFKMASSAHTTHTHTPGLFGYLFMWVVGFFMKSMAFPCACVDTDTQISRYSSPRWGTRKE